MGAMVMVEPIASAGDMPGGPGGAGAGRTPGPSITWIATVRVSAPASVLSAGAGGVTGAGGAGGAEGAGGATPWGPASGWGVSGRSTQ
ncbi:hypothetical protein [Promicromonospora sp. AC04]|uniref:hypothetical protein n=1 Tax=Promicromonospora sp. AC04 TaxID=2135723 RepID=UPI000D367206|nr:hypothetical protein [Promicromonospora sp. AC04]